MRLAEKIERFEIKWAKQSDTPWQNWSKSRKWLKRTQHRAWRMFSRQHLTEDAQEHPQYNRYGGWEY